MPKTYLEPGSSDTLFADEFLSLYKTKNLKNFVKTENFRENTKQWKMVYDPYMADKMQVIYGQKPPKSFQIRQKIFQEQCNILDRYSQVTPVNNTESVLE
mmetsp:Transcript_14147/g.22055  ORF Transcript_14147/g.22055 Transcript_14147/m.22055 type:complete len:100 (-) Transcript_14147:2670-2969(-)